MIFNSYTFMVFLPIAFFGYWQICRPNESRKFLHIRLWLQNLFIVVVSYVFYGWWDWRFLLLITITALSSFICGLGLVKIDNSKARKFIVFFTLVLNLGILGVFKYYNFFIESVVTVFQSMGFVVHHSSMSIILPVGISFYTFQAISYVIDVNRKQIDATRDVVAFLAFVSFFPQLVAGPIERASNLLPQFLKKRDFDYALAVEGCRQMFWGFLKKILVADTCALAANSLLNNQITSSISLWIGMIAFAFQIYGDFSGYSDIAIGCSKLFGIRLKRNFAYPYFARDIAEFWRRWHISLTTWFRDYLYIPLGGSRCGIEKKIRNTFIIFIISGLWHGANWTFVCWGCFHAICFVPLLFRGKNRRYITGVVAEEKKLPCMNDVVHMATTFVVVVIGWTFFRAPNIDTALSWLTKMLTFSGLNMHGVGLMTTIKFLPHVMTLVVVEWLNRTNEVPMLPKNRLVRWGVYYALFLCLLLFFPKPSPFIYFQF